MRVIILGGGFGGRSAAKTVYNRLAFDKNVEILLIDQNEYTTMLPSLPDILGNRIPHRFATAPLKDVLPKGVKILHGEVSKVHFKTKTVYLGQQELGYDYLVFAPGSKANFFRYDLQKPGMYKLDGLEDALKIREDFYQAVSTKDEVNAVVVGGGYTGIELACNLLSFSAQLRSFAGYEKKKVNITLVEREKRILPMLSEKLSGYAAQKLSEAGIQLMTGEEFAAYEELTVSFKSGKKLKDALLFWCPGVKIGFEAEGDYKTLPDGRILVNETLQLAGYPEVFVVGDAAAIKAGEGYLRRGVNFAEGSGKTAGYNVAAAINGDKLRPYKPSDPGWVIPILNSSVGVAFGIELKGRKGVFFHYVISGMKNYSFGKLLRYIGYGLKFPFAKFKV